MVRFWVIFFLREKKKDGEVGHWIWWMDSPIGTALNLIMGGFDIYNFLKNKPHLTKRKKEK